MRDSTADELGAALRNLLELRGIGLADLTASIVSSTVPQLRPEWEAMAERYLDHEMLVVGPGLKTGMALRYDNPREIGPDRLVNAVAAYDRVKGACWWSTSARPSPSTPSRPRASTWAGSSPGVEISMEALTDRAAALPKIELGAPRTLIGKTTVDAIRSGVIYGFAGQVDGIVRRLRAEMGEEPEAIATGGLAEHIVPVHRGDRRHGRPAHAHRPTLVA